jgi:uncharacterized protein (TIGR02246 family)
VAASKAQEIERMREDHIAALNNGDAEAWAAAFADDAVQMPPKAPANVGRENIRAWSARFLSAFRVGLSLVPKGVQGSGDDWAFEDGSYEITLTHRDGGEPIQASGRYITVYQRQPDGSWAMAGDIWNGDNPLPGPLE